MTLLTLTSLLFSGPLRFSERILVKSFGFRYDTIRSDRHLRMRIVRKLIPDVHLKFLNRRVRIDNGRESERLELRVSLRHKRPAFAQQSIHGGIKPHEQVLVYLFHQRYIRHHGKPGIEKPFKRSVYPDELIVPPGLPGAVIFPCSICTIENPPAHHIIHLSAESYYDTTVSVFPAEAHSYMIINGHILSGPQFIGRFTPGQKGFFSGFPEISRIFGIERFKRPVIIIMKSRNKPHMNLSSYCSVHALTSGMNFTAHITAVFRGPISSPSQNVQRSHMESDDSPASGSYSLL